MQLLALGSKLSIGEQEFTVTKITKYAVELVDKKGRIVSLPLSEIEKGIKETP